MTTASNPFDNDVGPSLASLKYKVLQYKYTYLNIFTVSCLQRDSFP